MIRKYRILVNLLLLAALFAACSPHEKLPIENLVERLIPAYAGQFVFESISVADSTDYYEIESQKDKIVIRGNNSNSMAVALNHYLKNYCHVTVSWYAADTVQMPATLPVVPEKIAVKARCKDRFFLNYCTFGYTMPWWQWKDWERLIDWMALNGVNMPLAITGQEAVWYKVWKKLGLTDEEIRNYFTGPAHLPWHRMSNLDQWQGPLPHSWLQNQEALQKKIVERERELNMRPVLPAFAGHVPEVLKRLYPEAKISKLSSWGGFADQYRSHFLDPMDPLFKKIQKEFLTEQTSLFGTSHIYGADPFNEVAPPSWEPDFLASVSRTIYESMTQVDPDATWLQMTWLFYIDRESWTNPRVKAFLDAVPRDKMLLLDYYCENTEVWKQTDHYFGQPYIWCYLGNFGGNTMLAGNLKEVGQRIENVFKAGGSNFQGLGSTLEAFDINPLMYEYVFEKAWANPVTDSDWIESLADRHIGTSDDAARKTWRILYDSIYTVPAALGQGTLTNARPSFSGQGNWTTTPTIHYSNRLLLQAWNGLLKANVSDRDAYLFDVVNLGRQVLGNYFGELRDNFTQAYKQKDQQQAEQIAQEMIGVLKDMDILLSTHSTFLLGSWIANARSIGVDEGERKYYEKNARTLITTWGDKAQSLNDYANRSWAGLTGDYYLPRWKMFLDRALISLKSKTTFDEKAFHEQVTDFEKSWTEQIKSYPTEPQGNVLQIARDLSDKYSTKINEQ